MGGKKRLSDHRLVTLDISQLDEHQRATFAAELNNLKTAQRAHEDLVFIDMSKLDDDQRYDLTNKIRDLSRKIGPGRAISAEAWMISLDDTINWF